MGITIKSVLVEVYWLIGLVECYYIVIYRAYQIIQEELVGLGIDRDIILQIAIKVVNNIVGPNSIVSILLVFGVFLYISVLDPLSLSII
jgi:hypothetical protein